MGNANAGALPFGTLPGALTFPMRGLPARLAFDSTSPPQEEPMPSRTAARSESSVSTALHRGGQNPMAGAPALSISAEKAFFFAQKAREFDVKDVVTDPDSGSNGADDGMVSVLEDHPDDPNQQELKIFINALTEDEQIDLVALTWLGRRDGEVSEWDEMREEALRLHNNRTGQYLLGKPMFAGHLGGGLAPA